MDDHSESKAIDLDEFVGPMGLKFSKLYKKQHLVILDIGKYLI